MYEAPASLRPQAPARLRPGSGQSPATGSGQSPATGSGQAPATGSGHRLRPVSGHRLRPGAAPHLAKQLRHHTQLLHKTQATHRNGTQLAGFRVALKVTELAPVLPICKVSVEPLVMGYGVWTEYCGFVLSSPGLPAQCTASIVYRRCSSQCNMQPDMPVSPAQCTGTAVQCTVYML